MRTTLAELVAELAEAGVGGHTRTAVARRVAEALSRSCALLSLEIGWCDPKSTRATVAVADPSRGGWRTREHWRGLHGTRVQRVLRSGEHYASTPSEGFSDESEAAGQGATQFVVVPLLAGEGEPGYVALSLEDPLPQVLAGSGLKTLGRVLRVAHRNCSLIERVASVSRQAHVRNVELREQVDRLTRVPEVVAKSPAMRAALERIDAVAAHGTSVLLLGESGTGKSVLARRIHASSSRAARPFVEVNCGALPETLIESELFGHSAGAFTGASKAHRGRFERANGGTLFLDEVGELPLGSQVKLLRALQDGVIEPLGSEREVSVDVRLLAATNQPLEQLVAQGEFREDLFYRLNVFPITVPPLRERQEDLPELVAQLLAEIGARLAKDAPKLSRAALRRLIAAPWPGNVRELANTLERSLILSKGKRLELSDDVAGSSPTPPAPDPDDERTFEEVVRACIERALRRTRGKVYGKGGAAEALGLNPSTLQTKMRKLGISRGHFVPR